MLYVDACRGAGLAIGLFTLVCLIGDWFRPGLDAGYLWISIPWLPDGVRKLLLFLFSMALV